MPEKIKDVQPPRGFVRLLMRLPIWIFRLHCSWLLGQRFLLLTHTGRKSGIARQTVLEVLQYQRASSIYYVLAAWAGKADWALNVEKTPDVVVTVGGRRFKARATRISPEEGERFILEYARQHPVARRVLPRLLGYRTDGTQEDFAALARLGTVFAFCPVSST
jgi:deazaflavin-dependent oxidoreductase (nitroreductase family)